MLGRHGGAGREVVGLIGDAEGLGGVYYCEQVCDKPRLEGSREGRLCGLIGIRNA
jgi:hypothetical protein